MKVHLYADDTQLYLAFKPDAAAAALDQMMDCIDEIRSWMEANMLKLNDSKTEFMVIGSKNTLAKISDDIGSIRVGDETVEAASSARNVGAILDSHMNLEDHVNSITKGCYHHLRNIGRIRRQLTEDAAKTLVQSLVLSKIDSLNSLLYGLPDKWIRKLQLVQNTGARIITGLGRYDHVTPALQDLHWLPIPYRIKYKICMLTFKCVHKIAPEYLCDLVETYVPKRGLRSANQGRLCEKVSIGKTYGDRAFSVCAPKLWNSLPENLRMAKSLETFKKNLKTHYFKLAYDM